MTALPEELVEEVLLRFPPDEPANLFRASVVCKPWFHLISSLRFRHRYRELHRTPPMLGFLCGSKIVPSGARFVPTSAFCSPIVDHSDCRALDVRHGRVLLYHQELGMEGVLVVRDPITHEQRRIPMPNLGLNRSTWKAAVVCATTADADAGSCDHFDCHRGSFLVVLVASYIPDIRIWTYSSDAGSWSDPVEYQRHGSYVDYSVPITLVGSTIFFGFWSNKIALKYDLESTKRSIDVVELPLLPFRQLVVLRTTEDGRLGLATVHESKLYMWSMEPEADGGWTCNRVIELEMLLRRNAILTEPDLVGFVERIGVIFLKADDVLFRVDLNTEKVENVYQRRGIYTVVPYMSFCTPGAHRPCQVWHAQEAQGD